MENSAGEGKLSAVAPASVEDIATLLSFPQSKLFCPPAISLAKPKKQLGSGHNLPGKSKAQKVTSRKDNVQKG